MNATATESQRARAAELLRHWRDAQAAAQAAIREADVAMALAMGALRAVGGDLTADGHHYHAVPSRTQIRVTQAKGPKP